MSIVHLCHFDSEQFKGNPDLIKKIALEISQKGRISFARFMELALYDVPYGYYMTQAVESDRRAYDRIGLSGDFFTAPELSPLLAKTLVRQVLEIDAQLGHPHPFTFMEIGGGNGTFAVDFLQECREHAKDFFNRLSYQIVERSPRLQARQAARWREVVENWVGGQVTWTSSLEEVASESVAGVVFSNELVDALPVHRVRRQHNQLYEVLVSYKGGRFVECLEKCSSAKLKDYMDTHKISLNEGQTSELHLAAEVWMSQVARILHRGVVLTIDYGHTGSDYYSVARKDGTLLCYYRHTISTDPYIRVGEQDMTAHVNFSVLTGSGTARGLSVIGLTTLANWLIGLGVEDFVRAKDQESEGVKALAYLLHPHGMGKTFKVLAQRKGVEPFALQGLRFPAFFDDVIS